MSEFQKEKSARSVAGERVGLVVVASAVVGPTVVLVVSRVGTVVVAVGVAGTAFVCGRGQPRRAEVASICVCLRTIFVRSFTRAVGRRSILVHGHSFGGSAVIIVLVCVIFEIEAMVLVFTMDFSIVFI